MKKTKLFLTLGIGLLSLGVAAGALVRGGETTPVFAADPTTKWAAIGDIGGSGWGKDLPFTFDSVDDRFELTLNMTANQAFKLRYNGGWGKQMKYDNNFNGTSNIPTYLKDGGGDDHNFVVKEDGNYTLCLDKGVESYSYGYTWALSIIKNEAKPDVTISFYDGTTLLDTVTQKEGDLFSSYFAEKEGYRLEGWYTEPELTKKYVNGTVLTTSISLYANYVAAEDYKVYVYDASKSLGASLSAYTFRGALDGGNNAWPGNSMTSTEYANIHVYSIDASKSFDSIIFNGGLNKPQTVDLTLNFKDTLYIIGAKETGGTNFTATSFELSAEALADYIMAEDTEGQCTTKYPFANRVYLLLNEVEQEAFVEDDTYNDAQARYEAWAASLGQTPYVVTTPTRGLLTEMTNQNNLFIVILVIAAGVIATILVAKTVKKGRKQD